MLMNTGRWTGFELSMKMGRFGTAGRDGNIANGCALQKPEICLRVLDWRAE